MGSKGIVASSPPSACSSSKGIGDTIRITLTPAPSGDRSSK